MKMKRSFCFFVVVLIILMGCTQIPASPSQLQSNSQISTKMPYTTPTNLLKTPTSTEIKITTTPNATSSPIDKCLTIEPNYPADSVSNGTLILSGMVDIGNNLVRYTAYKINMETHEKFELAKAGETILNVSVSPNGKWMAYDKYVLQEKKDYLRIEDSSGTHQRNIPQEKGWAGISSWLDNERLILHLDLTSSSETTPAKRSSTFVLFNPFNNKHQILQPDFPEIYVAQGYAGLTGRGYNPELNRVVYLSDNPAGDGTWHYILWSIDQQRDLASFEVAISPTGLPSWSPDGSKFALATSLQENIAQRWPAFELYSTSRDGQVSKLTNLTGYYPWVYIDDNYSWSPDGRYLAFWFSWWQEKPDGYELVSERYLAVVDTKNNMITNYCIPGKLQANGRVSPPVWSPNGKQLVVASPYLDDQSQIVIIDLENQKAFKIGENLTPEGWMINHK